MRDLMRVHREALEQQAALVGYWTMRAWQQWSLWFDLLEAEIYGERED